MKTLLHGVVATLLHIAKAVSDLHSVDSGQRTADSGQRTESGQRTTDRQTADR